MVFPRTLYFMILLCTVNCGESRTLKNDLNLKTKIAAQAPLGTKHEVNQVSSKHEKRTAVATYSSEVDNLFKKLFPSDRSCFNTAQQKSVKFAKYSEDAQRAVQLVNIYTQDCQAYIGSAPGKPLYATLNENLRSGNPLIVWNDMGTLLTKGLAILSPKTIPNLYRGCHCQALKIGTPFTFNQFASTTTNPKVAHQFLLSPPGKSFIHIKNARGTDIQPYSYFPSEKEILLDPGTNLDVVQIETDINRIRAEIKKILPTEVIPDKTVAKYVVLDGSRKAEKPKGGFWSTCICGEPKFS